MALTRASGYPDLSGITIPEIFAGKVLVSFYEKSVLPAISQSDYFNELKNKGDTAKIRVRPKFTISDYTVGGDIPIETKQPEVRELKIDVAKTYGIYVDEVDQFLSDINLLSDWAAGAGDDMREAVESHVLQRIYAQASSDNQGTAAGVTSHAYNFGAAGSPLGISKSNVIDTIVDANSALDEQKVPPDDINSRWLVAPSWFVNRIKKSDLQDASKTGDKVSVLRNGRVGIIDRTTVYSSQSLKTTTDSGHTVYYVLFGHKSALLFANALTKNEIAKREKGFGYILKGLNLFGFKVIRPEAMGVLYVYPA